MEDVYILGVGQIPVARYSDEDLGKLGGRAILRALDAVQLDTETVTALYVGNMLSGILSNQQMLGPLLATAAGLTDCEALTIEAACGSGGGAMRAGVMAIAAGAHKAVVVCGVEKMSHASREDTTRGLATASHWPTEGGMGESFVTLNARLMTAYRDAYSLEAADFAPFAINAHQNAVTNDCAMLRKSINLEKYLTSKELAAPIRLYDAPPICDGAAALVLGNADLAQAARARGLPVVKVTASACASDHVALSDRRDLLSLSAARLSSERAYRQADKRPSDIDLFEPHDAYTVMTALSLEAAGFAERGGATRLARDGELTLGGNLPITTFGGLKARGHPVGATGVYQLVECFMQLTDSASENQVPNAHVAMAQNLGGAAALAFTHILERA